MAWQDRHYYREQNNSTGGPLRWLVSGSLPLFTAFGIRVRAHSSMLLTIGLTLLIGLGKGFNWTDRVQSMTVLFAIVLLHEFGHCFAARWVGGEADDILMTPLGGLAFARAPHRWLPTFITVAAGPGVNVLICALAAGLLLAMHGGVPWNPILLVPGDSSTLFNVRAYTLWVYQISQMLLLFNLLPIYPLDGGQLLQSVLWWKLGYRKSMYFACVTGVVGAVIAAMIAIATRSLFLFVLAYCGFMTCYMMRANLSEMGPDISDETDYSAAYEKPPAGKRPAAKWRREARRIQKQVESDRAEQEMVDRILKKVSDQGMNSLTSRERKALQAATLHQRARDMESARRHG